MTMEDRLWNRCNVCGRFIALNCFHENASPRAVRNLLTPDSYLTIEEWETLCPEHADR
jgi:hypothetical protein